MFSFQLSAEQLAFRDAVRDFVTREVKPAANHQDRLQAGPAPLPTTILARASAMGLRTMALSELLGGAAADHLTLCVVGEELAAGDIGFAMTLMQTAALASRLFDHAMSAAQRALFLAPFLSDDDFHLAYAGCDRDHDDGGWNYHRAEASALAAPVSAVMQGSELVLNGRYVSVPNAPLAKLMVVQVLIGRAVERVLVPTGLAGLTITPSARIAVDEAGDQSLRWCHVTTGAATFTDCRVPRSYLLQGCTQLYDSATASGRGSPLMQALNLGIGRAAYEAAVTYSKLRVQGGRLIIEHQAIGTVLAEIAIRLETARALVWKAAWAADHPEADAVATELPLQTIAQAYTAQAVQEATLLAAECFGAMGVMRDMPQPHYVNDARVFAYGLTSSTTTKLRLAEAIAGFTRA